MEYINCGDTRLYYDDFTITHILLTYYPHFLMLNEEWVDLLLEKEIDCME